MVYLKSLLFLVVAPGTVTALVPWLLMRASTAGFDPGPARHAGLVVMVLGSAGLLRCFWDFARHGRGTPAPIDAPTRLVVKGLYRHVRNPMYVCVVTVVAGEVLRFGRWALVAWALGVWLIFHLFVVVYEERALRRQFGAEYEGYCRKVGRWVPRIRPWVSIE
jgi:protein-S-isoprenylcysteine O-methyltransferase Ste14